MTDDPRGSGWGGERAALAAVALGTILAPLNSTMIAVSLPRIIDDFDSSVETTGWLITSYLITLAVLQPFAGRLGDALGRRRLVMGALVLFALASLGAALAHGLVELIAFRVLQAVAGAVIVPNGSAVVRQILPEGRRAAGFGTIGAAAASTAALGPTVGGLITGGLGWRAVFAANIPVIALALLFTWRSIPAAVDAERLGRAREPFRPARAFAAATSGIAFSNLAFYTSLIATPIVLDHERGWSPVEIGLALTVLSAPSALMAKPGGRLADRLGRRFPSVLGHAIAGAALVPLVIGGTDAPAILLPLLGVAGFGFGLTSATLQTSAVEAVPPVQAGLASGLFSTSRYVGSIIGSICLGQILHATGRDVDGFHTLAAILAAAAVCALVVSFGLNGRRVTPGR